ncbi:hypothetical protein [Streptomyces anulatus]|uniref:hypothetical protein n=1 Tax=Streptomyces anulatus TaxID=1892 RepID=UPI0033213DC8
MTLGTHAHHVAPIIAEDIYRQAADAGDADAMVNLGLLLAEAGRTGEAETSLSSVRRRRRQRDQG